MKLGPQRNYHNKGREAIRHYANQPARPFFVIVKTGCGTDGALHSTNQDEEELFRHLNLSGVLAHENINRCGCWWLEI